MEQANYSIRHLFPALATSNYVPGEGPDELPVAAFIVGSAPGAQEDVRKRPFVGPSGLLLRQLINIGGLNPAQCWITNAVKFRPPQNRKPTLEEIQAFRRTLIDEWHLVGKPKLIIPVGNGALSAILGKPTAVLRMAGKAMHRNHGVIVYPMIHPGFALKDENKGARDLIERDWERLKTWKQSHMD